MKYHRIAAAVCGLSLVLCACGNSGTVVPQRKTKLAPPFSALSEIKAGRKNIYLIVKDLDSDYWRVVIDGAKDAGADFGCNVYYSGTYAEEDWKFQEDLLEDALRKHADAVVIAPDDSVRLAPKISELQQKDVQVILIDTGANTDDYSLCLMTDNLAAGQQAAEEMLSLMREKGHTDSDPVQIGVMVSTSHSQTINERLAGFIGYWTQHAPDGWQVLPDIKCFDDNAEYARVLAEQMLKENAGITGLFGTNNSATIALCDELMEEGRTDVAMVGFDYSPSFLELMTSPDYCAASIVQRQYDMSYEGIQAALNCIDGKKMPVKFMDMGVVTVNGETMYDAEVQEILSHN